MFGAQGAGVKEFLFTKGVGGLVPACEEANEWMRKKRLGATIMVEPREMRNGPYFKKWMALVSMAFEYWADNAKTLEFKGKPVLPNFDRFRKDVTISAGFYYPVANLKGEVRIEAESLSWASMDEQRFSELYDATIRVLLARVFNGKVCPNWTEADLRSVVTQIESFAA